MPDRDIVVFPTAQTDIDEQTEFLIVHDSAAVAERFLADISTAFERVIRFPHIGRPWSARSHELRGVRRLRLSTFPLSVFYRPTPRTIEVLRVLHHSRRLPPDLDDEPQGVDSTLARTRLPAFEAATGLLLRVFRWT